MKKRVNIFILIVLTGFAVWAGRGIFKYTVFYTHDLKHHIARSYDAVNAIREGHFPLRWAGAMNYECGLPLFNFYYPLLYYLTVLINVFSGSLLMSLKIVSFISLFGGTLFFYLWMREETKDAWASFAGAILYLYAPYRFSLIYVRGSPEYLSYAILPVVLYFFARLFNEKENSKFVWFAFWAAVAGGFLMISHNIVSLFLIPVIFAYLIIKFIQNKNLGVKRVLLIIFSFLSAFGLGSFFIFPALLEQKFTKISIPIFNYYDHFPALWQVLRSKWGYGDSAIGETLDAMSFQLGYAHWIALALVVSWVVAGFLTVFAKKEKIGKFVRDNIFIAAFSVLSILSLYLMLPVSLPVWKKIEILQTIQFPWRLLGVSVFAVSSVFAFWLAGVRSKFLYWGAFLAVSLFAVAGNRNHLLPQPVLENDLPFYLSLDKSKFERRMLPGFAETVLPVNASSGCYPTTPVVSTDVKTDKITFEEVERGSTFGKIKLEMQKKKISGEEIIFNLSYFPQIYDFKINNLATGYNDCGGKVCEKLDSFSDGKNVIEWKVVQTKIQKISNLITVIFFGVWTCIIVYHQIRKPQT